MRRRRTLSVLAMLTALLMAPSTMFGAAPNELRSATVQPMSGSTTTAFRLTSHYVSTAGNAALSVRATFASSTVALSLTAGTPIDGVWAAVTQLPAGTWTITFATTTAKGPEPKLTVSSVVVTPVTSPAPGGPGGGTPSTEAPGSDQPSGSGLPAPTASGAPASPAAEPRATSRPPAPAATASPAAAPGHTDTSGGGPAGEGGPRPSTSPRSGAPADPASTSGPVGPASLPGAEPNDDLNTVLLTGFLAVAGVTLVGAGWLAIAARRRADEEATADASAAGVDPAVAAVSAIQRRALRRARLRASDDPILAALGIGESEPQAELEGRLPRSAQRVKRKR